MRTVCPMAAILRANHCEPEQASIPTKAGPARSKNCKSVSRRKVAFWIGIPGRRAQRRGKGSCQCRSQTPLPAWACSVSSLLPPFKSQLSLTERTGRVIPLMVGPAAKREAVAHLQAELGLSERRACSIVGADRKMVRYRSCRPPDTELRGHLRELANARRRFGYRRLFVLLRQQGEPSGRNRIYRLYREEGLSVRKRRARR